MPLVTGSRMIPPPSIIASRMPLLSTKKSGYRQVTTWLHTTSPTPFQATWVYTTSRFQVRVCGTPTWLEILTYIPIRTGGVRGLGGGRRVSLVDFAFQRKTNYRNKPERK